jgi:outer membrane protein assembly factor BamB
MPPRLHAATSHDALRRLVLAAAATAAASPLASVVAQEAQPGRIKSLEGLWGGELAHKGERTEVYVALAPGSDGAMRARVSLPVLNLYDVPLGRATLTGNTLRFASLSFDYDTAADRLTGTMPADLVPVYALATTLTRKARLERHNRPELDAPLRSPAWTAELGTPVWADIVAAGGALYVGADDGKLRALDAQTGAGRWTYTAAGPLRSGPTVAGDRLYVTSDDGILHCLGARDAKPVWQLRVNRMPAERLPATDPKSCYDFHGAPVTVVRNTVYAGTHEGRVLALDARDGSARWSFSAGDRILAAPFVAGDRVLVGCYDGRVYALDAASGALRWTFDAKAPITSTPVLTHGVVVVGSRGYDLWGLDGATGRPRWNRYIWFSWIESTVVVAGRHGYVGSSDAARLFAFDTSNGTPVWNADVHGYAWGTPVLDGARIYIGTRGEAAAIAHRGHALALDRASGRVIWRYPFPAADPTTPHGYAGSGALLGGRLYLAAVDGRVHAFDTR